MSQIIINIANESLKEKILWFLSRFKDDGVQIEESKDEQQKKEYSKEYLEKNWKKLAMGTRSSKLNDDEMLEIAHEEHYNEKYNY